MSMPPPQMPDMDNFDDMDEDDDEEGGDLTPEQLEELMA